MIGLFHLPILVYVPVNKHFRSLAQVCPHSTATSWPLVVYSQSERLRHIKDIHEPGNELGTIWSLNARGMGLQGMNDLERSLWAVVPSLLTDFSLEAAQLDKGHREPF